MKGLLFGGLIAVLVAGSAVAADMPVKAPPMVVAPTWTGTYVGFNAGYGWAQSNHTNPAIGVTTGDFNLHGGLAGVTYGGNWQAGHVVLGFESDLDWAHINGVGGVGVVCGVGCFTNTKWLSTERMRAGWDFNGWLVYGTAGAAFGRVQALVGSTACVPGTCIEKTRAGWTAGVGVETMFWQNWSAKLEYLHYDLGTDVMLATPISVQERGDIVRFGINYHFDMLGLLHLN
jgi:outer membrane immunogenic protein